MAAEWKKMDWNRDKLFLKIIISNKKLLLKSSSALIWLNQPNICNSGCARLGFVSSSVNAYGSPGGSDGKESACNAGDPSLITGLGRSPCEGNGYPLWYPCLENSMDRGPGGPQSLGSQRARHDWATNTFPFSQSVLGCVLNLPTWNVSSTDSCFF